MRTSPLDVLYEDNHLLAVSKPCGVVTMGLRDGQSTLLTEAKDYIKRKYAKPGNVYLGIVSRLDAIPQCRSRVTHTTGARIC